MSDNSSTSVVFTNEQRDAISSALVTSTGVETVASEQTSDGLLVSMSGKFVDIRAAVIDVALVHGLDRTWKMSKASAIIGVLFTHPISADPFPRTFTATEYVFACINCEHRVHVSREMLDNAMSSATEHGGHGSDAQFAKTFDTCLKCSIGDSHPLALKEMHAADCEPCERELAQSVVDTATRADVVVPVTNAAHALAGTSLVELGIGTCEGCDAMLVQLIGGYIRQRGDAIDATARSVKYCVDCWELVDSADENGSAGAAAVDVERVPADNVAAAEAAAAERSAYGSAESHTLRAPIAPRYLPAVRSAFGFDPYDVLQIENVDGSGWIDFMTLRTLDEGLHAASIVDAKQHDGRAGNFRIVSIGKRVKYPVPLSFSDTIIAVEDGELPESAVAPRVAPASLLAESPSEFADALRELLANADDFEFPDVDRVESYAEAGILRNVPQEDGIRVTLVNGCTFLVKVTQQ